MKSPPERISCSPRKKGADPIPYGGLTRVGLLGDIVPPDADDVQGSRYARRQGHCRQSMDSTVNLGSDLLDYTNRIITKHARYLWQRRIEWFRYPVLVL